MRFNLAPCALSSHLGGRGQPRRMSRVGKRPVISDSAPAAAAAAVAAAGPQSPGMKAKRVSQTKNKARTGEANVLWSPTRGANDSGGSSSIGDGGVNGDGPNGHGGGGRSLSSLASSFKARYGEDLGLEDDEVEDNGNMDNAGAQQPPARRKRSLSGSIATAVEETARAMSPGRLAGETQRARARARQERFGGGSKASMVPAKSSSLGKLAAKAPLPPSRTPSRISPESTRGPSIDAGGRGTGAENETGKAPAVPMSSLPRVAPLPVTVVSDIVTPSVPSASATVPAPVTNTSRVAEQGGPLGPSVVSPMVPAITGLTVSPPGSASPTTAALPIVTATDTEEEDTSVLGPMRTPATVESNSSDETPTTGATPKRRAPEDGDVVVIEPPAKKMLGSTTQQGAPPPEKVHTLRLRLRTERKFDSGVEESKGFDHPNPREDNGVEECKGFDPPNLPRPPPLPQCPPSPSVPAAAVSPPESTVQATDSQPPAASAGDEETSALAATVVSLSNEAAEAAPTETLVRQNSWGPSFGIPGQADSAPVAVAPAAAAPSNPWILSPNAPTFARNQGRPLAHSFLTPAANAAGGVNETRASGSDNDNAAVVNVPRPTVAISRVSNGRDVFRAIAAGNGGNQGGGGVAIRPEGAASPGLLDGTRSTSTGALDARAEQGLDSAAPSSLPSSNGQAGVLRRDSLLATEVGVGGGNTGAGMAETAAAANDCADEAVVEVSVGKRAGELLERLKREREESKAFERKLTQALLDL